uniref:NLR family CARD domain-containing protein 3-like n=1 Tax=Gouania willdenowi TaxID=441366 RepID=A0A8C5GYE6_GOUWI
MSRSEETDEALLSLVVNLPDEHDQTGSVWIVQETEDSSSLSSVSIRSSQPMDHQQGKLPGIIHETEDSSSSSCVSLKSSQSMDLQSEELSKIVHKTEDSSSPSCVAYRSDQSMDHPMAFKQEKLPGIVHKTEDSSSPSCVSYKSNQSMDHPLVFNQKEFSKIVQKTEDSSSPSCVSYRSDQSMDHPLVFTQEMFSKGHKRTSMNINSTFKNLEKTFDRFVSIELKKLKSQVLDCEDEDEDGDDSFEGIEMEKTREAFMCMTLQFLRGMEQEELADTLEKKRLVSISRLRLKANLKNKSQHVFEGIAKAGQSTLLNQIYTELYITEGGAADVNIEHEIRQIEKTSRESASSETAIRCEDFFKSSYRSVKPVRTILTKGVAGIGKTVCTQKFTLDWADGQTNQDIDFLFPFTFRELNLLKEKRFSLIQLIHHFFPETKDALVSNFEEFQIVIILDSLDECRLPLDLYKCEIMSDVSQSTSVDVLLANLINKKLLPSAQLWITTRPAAASQIPPECVDMVTEVRGFNNEQKNEYFMKRFPDEDQASRVISHIKSSRTLHIMCHIPVFCWITATVFDNVLKSFEAGNELPECLTKMYIYFLVTQTKLKIIKYDGGAETDLPWNQETRVMIESLGKLAFEQLLKGNLYFYDFDLTECGIDVKAASLYSGVLTEIFQEDQGLYQNKVFCFIHLSIQEFLAALHVHLTFTNTGINLLSEEKSTISRLLQWFFPMDPSHFYQTAIEKALQSNSGHLDLFLRFLLGLSLQENQTQLEGLVTQMANSSLVHQKTAEYIKIKIRENPSPEKSTNLFHCLKELNDCSLITEIQNYLKSENSTTDELSASQWSALVFILQSEGDIDTFNLRKYSASDNALQHLLPVVQTSTKAVLSCCNLTERSCKALTNILGSPSCRLKELDLSNNDLQDKGVLYLCECPPCTLETLSLSGCQITKRSGELLVSALSSNLRHLKKLDLTYNNLGETAVKKLSALQKNPNCGLEILRVNPGGPHFITPGLKKYASKLKLDPITANKKLVLSKENKKVTVIKEKQPYDDHPERFDYWKQVLCADGLTSRCFYEVEWEGEVYMGVTYKEIKRKGEGDESCLGKNNKSWSVHFSEDRFSEVIIKGEKVFSRRPSKRVGVYLDWDAGTLSFFNVFSDKVDHIYTYHTKFTGPVFPAFRIRIKPHNSSVFLCEA